VRARIRNRVKVRSSYRNVIRRTSTRSIAKTEHKSYNQITVKCIRVRSKADDRVRVTVKARVRVRR
jgi:hypothetical protein